MNEIIIISIVFIAVYDSIKYRMSLTELKK